MILDKENLFASATAITATGQVGDVIDMGTKGVLGNESKFFVNVDTSLAGTAASYAEFALQASDSSTFASGNVTLCESGAIGLTTMAAGATIWSGSVPNTGSKRYLRLYATNSVTFTDGALTAGLACDLQTNTQSNS